MTEHCVSYMCRYAPLELFAAMGAETSYLSSMPEEFGPSVSLLGSNICGFGKSLLDRVLAGEITELVLTNCCDTIRSVYDVICEEREAGHLPKLKFVFFLDLPRDDGACSIDLFAKELRDLKTAYEQYSRNAFDVAKFYDAVNISHIQQVKPNRPYLALLGGKAGKELHLMAVRSMPLPVQNATCAAGRTFGEILPEETMREDEEALFAWYAGELLRQIPCMRMQDAEGRKKLFADPNLKGILYHTIRFCDFYSFEYADIKNHAAIPILKFETDYTKSANGQLATRFDAFAEEILTKYQDTPEIFSDRFRKGRKEQKVEAKNPDGKYYAGIDSGSASTDVVILDRDRNLVTSVIRPTGAGAGGSAEKALQEALDKAGLSKDDLAGCVATGYGRAAIETGSRSITEITCHAKGARFLDPTVRCVIDIGGQDSKVIALDENGNVENFVMNDKCAAGTGRFLDMMARTMEMSLDEMSKRGLTYQEDITISSTCTVFAESEVVSLIAQNRSTDDIVHGLDKSVAAKTAQLAARVRGKGPYMMTGGVAKNEGVVRALEEKLGEKLIVSDKAQICGALGAALFAIET